jgi:hypothetical protein
VAYIYKEGFSHTTTPRPVLERGINGLNMYLYANRSIKITENTTGKRDLSTPFIAETFRNNSGIKQRLFK